MNKVSGIFIVTNILTDEKYIGESDNIFNTLNSYVTECLNDTSNIQYNLFYDIKKYGITSFNFEILEVCSEEELNNRFQYWYNSFNKVTDINSKINIVINNNEEPEYWNDPSWTNGYDNTNYKSKQKNKIKNKKYSLSKGCMMNDGIVDIYVTINNISEYKKKGWKVGRLKKCQQ